MIADFEHAMGAELDFIHIVPACYFDALDRVWVCAVECVLPIAQVAARDGMNECSRMGNATPKILGCDGGHSVYLEVSPSRYSQGGGSVMPGSRLLGSVRESSRGPRGDRADRRFGCSIRALPDLV